MNNSIKILVLGDVNSAHIKKWVSELCNKGLSIGVFSLTIAEPDNPLLELANFELLSFDGFNNQIFKEGQIKKAVYIKMRSAVKKVIAEFQPDILHAHYASSYGLLGALSGFSPYLISAWGSDVLLFPKSNILNRQILKFNFRKADLVLNTSKVLYDEVGKYSSVKKDIIAFGVDTQKFFPLEKNHKNKDFTFGTVKSLEMIYGIDVLIKAFAKFHHHHPESQLKILGEGSQEKSLKELANKLNINHKVEFLLVRKSSELPAFYNQLDVSIFMSRSESFGVSVLEAAACACPSIASRLGGLPEVIENGKTGYLVDSENVDMLLEKMLFLKAHPETLKSLGEAALEKVKKEYELEACVQKQIAIYQKFVKKSKA